MSGLVFVGDDRARAVAEVDSSPPAPVPRPARRPRSRSARPAPPPPPRSARTARADCWPRRARGGWRGVEPVSRSIAPPFYYRLTPATSPFLLSRCQGRLSSMVDGFFGSLGDFLAAANGDELRDILAQVDATVPDRTEGCQRPRGALLHRPLPAHSCNDTACSGSRSRSPRTSLPDFRSRDGTQQLIGIELHGGWKAEEFQKAATTLEKAPKGSWLIGSAVDQETGGSHSQGRGYVRRRVGAPVDGTEVLGVRAEEDETLPSYVALPGYQLLIYDNTELLDVTGGRSPSCRAGWQRRSRIGRWSQPLGTRHFSRISSSGSGCLMYDVRAVAPWSSRCRQPHSAAPPAADPARRFGGGSPRLLPPPRHSQARLLRFGSRQARRSVRPGQ